MGKLSSSGISIELAVPTITWVTLPDLSIRTPICLFNSKESAQRVFATSEDIIESKGCFFL